MFYIPNGQLKVSPVFADRFYSLRLGMDKRFGVCPRFIFYTELKKRRNQVWGRGIGHGVHAADPTLNH